MLRALHRLILAGAAFALPLSASAHGTDFLLAKITQCRDGGCRLEVTADFAQSPMYQDENEARRAIAEALLIRHDPDKGDARALSAPQFERRAKFDPTTPAFMPDEELKREHQLIAGVWHLPAESSSIQFEIAPGAGHDTLLWLVDERQTDDKSKWVMLLPGDRSPVISVPPSRSSHGALIATAIAGTCLGVIAWRRRMIAAPLCNAGEEPLASATNRG